MRDTRVAHVKHRREQGRGAALAPTSELTRYSVHVARQRRRSNGRVERRQEDEQSLDIIWRKQDGDKDLGGIEPRQRPVHKRGSLRRLALACGDVEEQAELLERH